MFTVSTILTYISDAMDLPYSSHTQPSRHNFLLIATVLIPLFWIISHSLHWIYNNVLDSGAATCGATFILGKKIVTAQQQPQPRQQNIH